MKSDHIDTFSTEIEGVPLDVRYGVDAEDGEVYIISAIHAGDDLMGLLSDEIINSSLEPRAKKEYDKYVKLERDHIDDLKAEEIRLDRMYRGRFAY